MNLYKKNIFELFLEPMIYTYIYQNNNLEDSHWTVPLHLTIHALLIIRRGSILCRSLLASGIIA